MSADLEKSLVTVTQLFATLHHHQLASQTPSATMRRSCKVAVIGAGVSGLTAARELLREGHRVVVFEKSNSVGGTWAYDPQTESDPLGHDPARRVVHGGLYRSLRTNLPRTLMGFVDYDMPSGGRSYGDPREFPGHEEVLAFLQGFAREFGILEVVRFETEVVGVEMGGTKDEWVVASRRKEGAEGAETFQAVVVCNGHHTQPLIADDIPGIDRWPGKQIHSHNYRIPEPFQNKVAIIIGKGPSALDISRDISKVSKEVHLSSRSLDVKAEKLDGHDNIWQHSKIKCVYEDGKVDFTDGSSLFADIIFHCTGYKYHFPFLDPGKIVSIDGNCVGPLYKHVFPPSLAPWISFVGLTKKSLIFLTIDLQSKWIARVLSGKIDLPPEENMISSVEDFYALLAKNGVPKRFTHSLHPNEDEYLNWLLGEVGLPPLEEWRIQMFRAAVMSICSHDDRFRDIWHVDHWNMQPESVDPATQRKQSC